MKIPKKRGRPRLSNEEKARRKTEREAAKKAAADAGLGKSLGDVIATQKKGKNKIEIKTTTSFLLTPAGRCPVELHGFDKEAIAIWVSHVRNFKSKNTQHTFQSIRYWLRDFFYINSKEYKIAEANLKEVISEFDIINYEPFLKKKYDAVKRGII